MNQKNNEEEKMKKKRTPLQQTKREVYIALGIIMLMLVSVAYTHATVEWIIVIILLFILEVAYNCVLELRRLNEKKKK